VPIFPQQGFMDPYPVQSLPGPYPTAQARPPATAWAPAVAQQPLPRPRVIRAQVQDEPAPRAPVAAVATRPAVLPIPTPEELGVSAWRKPQDDSAIDWAGVHTQLDRLGATCFHLEKLPQGGCRITCFLPTGQQGRNRRIEVEAASDAEAVRSTLAKAEEWVSGQ
jgi:hypothetical protein